MSGETLTPKAGLRFRHARLLEKVSGQPVSAWPKQVCRVTAVRKDRVYYRAEDEPGRGTHWVMLSAWPNVALPAEG